MNIQGYRLIGPWLGSGSLLSASCQSLHPFTLLGGLRPSEGYLCPLREFICSLTPSVKFSRIESRRPNGRAGWRAERKPKTGVEGPLTRPYIPSRMHPRPALRPTLCSTLPPTLAGFARGLPARPTERSDVRRLESWSDIRAEEQRQKSTLHAAANAELETHIAHLPAMITQSDGTYHFADLPSLQP